MAEARSRQAWAHTSSLLAMLANIHRDPKKTRAYKPADFNPHASSRKLSVAKVDIEVLKQVFVSNRQEPI
jgi:plasmid replication initiation protein